MKVFFYFLKFAGLYFYFIKPMLIIGYFFLRSLFNRG